MMLQSMIDQCSGGDFTFWLDTWLDEFRLSPDGDRLQMISAEPDMADMEKIKRVILAAAVEDCCIRFAQPVPGWVNKPDYFLSVPYYAWDASRSEHKRYFENEAPKHFKKRIFFAQANAFDRT